MPPVKSFQRRYLRQRWGRLGPEAASSRNKSELMHQDGWRGSRSEQKEVRPEDAPDRGGAIDGQQTSSHARASTRRLETRLQSTRFLGLDCASAASKAGLDRARAPASRYAWLNYRK